MKKPIFTIACLLVFLLYADSAWAWNGITHYQINKAVSIEPSDIFGVSGTGPDMSVQWIGDYPAILDEEDENQKWPDYFHSPNPKYEDGQRRFVDKPNFGYLMLKASEKNGECSEVDSARALGWGGHIAADWVAHNDNLFPICPTGSLGEKKHFIGETLCELYSFLTKGPITSSGSLSMAFDDRQIYKALYNYRLISIHEYYVKNQLEINDDKLKEKALATTLPKSYIRQRIKRWAAKLTAIQSAYSQSPLVMNPLARIQFTQGLQQKQIESNLALAEVSVRAWTTNPTPRGKIPDYSQQVVPFYEQKLMDVPPEASLSISGQSVSAVTTETARALYSMAQSATIGAEEENDLLWQSIIDTSCERGYLAVDDTETADGLYLVDVAVRDEAGLMSVVAEEVNRRAVVSEERSHVVTFWKRLLVDGVADPDLLADIEAPRLSVISPPDGSYSNIAAPDVVAAVDDGPDGSGVTDGVVLSVDGIPIEAEVIDGKIKAVPPATLPNGAHQVSLTVCDRAGNASTLSWGFTVDTVAPKLCYKVKNRTVAAGKPAEVAISPNEPVRYRLTVVPVVGGYPDDSTVIAQWECDQQTTLTWDGADGQGARVAPGKYLMYIHAIDRAGNVKILKIYVSVL